VSWYNVWHHWNGIVNYLLPWLGEYKLNLKVNGITLKRRNLFAVVGEHFVDNGIGSVTRHQHKIIINYILNTGN